MADQQVGNALGVAAVNVGGTTNRSNINGGASGAPQAGLDIDNADTISALRTRLAAIDAGFYTAEKLNTMTLNDMIYAVRLNDNASSIKQ